MFESYLKPVKHCQPFYTCNYNKTYFSPALQSTLFYSTSASTIEMQKFMITSAKFKCEYLNYRMHAYRKENNHIFDICFKSFIYGHFWYKKSDWLVSN